MSALEPSEKIENNEEGYSDIYSHVPYIDAEDDGERVLIHMLYVPPLLRHKGEGKSLFKRFLSELPSDKKYLRLIAASLGSGDTASFWKSFSFTPAYICDCESTSRILHLAVNGFELPPVEMLNNDEERHYIFD